jgi:hypothetical protein
MTKIAVEQGLRPFQKALETAGFMVVEVQRDEDLKSLRPHAVVISGLDRDFLGLDDGGRLPVIDAAGRTPEEIVDEVRRNLGPRE